MVWQLRIKWKKAPLYAQTEPFETQDEPPFAPQTEPVVAAQTDSSDTEYIGTITESESSFEDSDYSVEDLEEVVQPLFTDSSCRNQFRTHFEEEKDASEIRVKRSSLGTWKRPAPARSAPTLQDQTTTSDPAQQGSTQPPPIQVVRWMLKNNQESSTTQPPKHL
ncbi:hypothetical protein V6N11_008601 [Hibiscus sabdariffa]|uniref:Uncharacterized protein n=1 Tax=Hibiscus sabdariffa TaxID=183260 RepID=A0ABR2PNU5_9ROSI